MEPLAFGAPPKADPPAPVGICERGGDLVQRFVAKVGPEVPVEEALVPFLAAFAPGSRANLASVPIPPVLVETPVFQRNAMPSPLFEF